MSYTPEEAEPLIPDSLRRIAKLVVEAMICLDKHPVNSYQFERYIFGIEGSIGHLVKLCTTVWKAGKMPKKMIKDV